MLQYHSIRFDSLFWLGSFPHAAFTQTVSASLAASIQKVQ